jgi:hypothetical protein
MIKRFLVPVLALAALGLPARASIVPYCDNGCGLNTTAVFNSLVTSTPYTYAYVMDQTFTGSLTSSTDYIDGTGVEFMDTASSNTFSITGAFALQTSGTNGTILITIPEQFIAVQLSLSSGAGTSNFTCIDANCDGTQLSTAPIFVDYTNTTPGAAWTIQISAVSPESIVVDGFNPATAGSQAQTPEVGTLLLIGSGLIGMRWMKRLPKPRFFRSPQTT